MGDRKINAAAAALCFAPDSSDDDNIFDDDEQPVFLSKDFLVSVSLDSLDEKPEKLKQVQRYESYLQSMLAIGEGETIIELGVSIDDALQRGLSQKDLEISEAKHDRIVKNVGAVATHLVTKQSGGLFTSTYLVRNEIEAEDFIEVRVAVVGNVDAGKSTLLGVLTHSTLDDGRGLARQKLFRHKHEFESGRTSSVGNDILGFGVDGKVINRPDNHSGHLDWVKICHDSAKVITFIDLAGHEKYLKTTIFGMTGHVPDYTMLMVRSHFIHT
ncbi:hypothetical protein AB6A40_009503 [Gnathostoma spinigerum]|uniref:Tr-type G domain-containing protein n=1 Tax=Gnathostoma spinigerum TaxID=75299 RepID=A0ABD6EXB4_9BILA